MNKEVQVGATGPDIEGGDEALQDGQTRGQAGRTGTPKSDSLLIRSTCLI